MAVGTYALTTLAKLKSFMSISGSGNDTLLENSIDRTTALFETETRRKLLARDYSYDSDSSDYDADNAIMDGNNRDEIALPQYPVNSVTTIKINSTSIPQRDTVFDTGWVLDKKNGILRMIGYLFSEGMANIELEYNASYSTVPDDLESACSAQAAWLFKQSVPGGNLLGVSSKNLADGSINYTAKDLLPSVKSTLHNYKRRFSY